MTFQKGNQLGKLNRGRKQSVETREKRRKSNKKAWENPTNAMLNSARENLKIAYKSPKFTVAVCKNLEKTRESPKQKVAARKSIKKANKGLNCHHKNGNHNDDNQFNLGVLPGEIHHGLGIHTKEVLAKAAKEVKFLTEMYHGD